METILRIAYADENGITVEEIEEYGNEAVVSFVDDKVYFNDKVINISDIRSIGTIRGNF